MPPLGAALGDHEVPALADPVQVRRLGEHAAVAGPERPLLAEHRAGGGVDDDLFDAAVRADVGPGEDEPGVGHVRGAVVAPGEVGVDALDVDHDAVAPRARGVGGGEEAGAPARRVGDDEEEHAVAVPDRRRPDAQVGRRVGHAELRVADRDVPDLRPGDQVGRVVDRHAGQVLEGRGGQVVVVADADDARVRVEARDEGVREAGHDSSTSASATRSARLVPTCSR